MKYRQNMLECLVRYKEKQLKVADCGKWRDGVERPHILPDRPEAIRLNILEPYREAFWDYHGSSVPPVKLQRDFAHLNSSQAMCFNLFFPLIHEQAYPVLLDVLGIKGETVNERDSRFEAILDEKEYTNFDFHLRLRSGRRLLFEVKFSEQDFGTRKPSPRALDKVKDIYRPRLLGKVPPEYLETDRLFASYQILRNMSYLDGEGGNHLFFVYPQANVKLDSHRGAIESIGAVGLSKCCDIVHLEEMVAALRSTISGHDRLRRHYDEFAEKYLMVNTNG